MNLIVLCGGRGTRLGALTSKMPKPMLSVAGHPFLIHVLNRVVFPEISGVVMAAGFEWEKINSYFGRVWNGLPIRYSVESVPLGTGGAIKNACSFVNGEEVLIINGDTIFDIDVLKFVRFARNKNAQVCIALRKVDNCDRYGRVTLNAHGEILSFGEKGCEGGGLINAGIYYLRKNVLNDIRLSVFSFEVDFLQAKCSSLPVFGMPFDDYFIDIGIPDDLLRAQIEIENLVKK